MIAYELLLTDAYPPFTFDDDPAYPVRLALPEPQRLNRAAVFFRMILAIPASIVGSVVAFGASTLMIFIAWLITLVAGRLPASLHGAFTAVVRYEVRYYAYWWMLTPTYPGGLFGDKPGIPTWADQPAAPTAPAAPGYGTAESVYGSAPGGYGAPYSPYAPSRPVAGGPGYGAPARLPALAPATARRPATARGPSSSRPPGLCCSRPGRRSWSPRSSCWEWCSGSPTSPS